MLQFDWDPRKNNVNRKKHGVSFEEATTCFFDPMHVLIQDPDHSDNRLILIGTSSKSRVLIVVHLDRDDDQIRVISARKATRTERQQYEEV